MSGIGTSFSTLYKRLFLLSICQTLWIHCTALSLLLSTHHIDLFQFGGLSSITGSASSPYIPSSDFSPLPPLRSTAGLPSASSVVTRGAGRPGLASILDGPLGHYSLTSPSYEPHLSHVSPLMSASQHQEASQEPLLDNSNLCDILMLERALENQAAMSAVMGQTGENKVDMLEIPGKGRCYVYLAR